MTLDTHQKPLLDPRDAREITRVLKPFTEDSGASVILFGSRARGDARRTSDIDVALQANQPLPSWALARLREQLEESNLPFRVDLVDYSTLTEEFKRAIDEEGIPWPM